ncbi:unnamed protein product, partial [Heterotrigona itama]
LILISQLRPLDINDIDRMSTLSLTILKLLCYIKEYSDKETFRLLETDNRVILPFKISLRIKVDAVPGRVNQLNLFSIRPGIYFGQCSEICGINHRFIPICLKVQVIITSLIE